MTLRSIGIGAAVAAVAAIAAAILVSLLWPSSPSLQKSRPTLVAVPPLQPLTGTSTVLAPAAVALAAIRDALDAQAPKSLSGKPQNPLSKALANAQVNISITRGPLAAVGRADALAVTTTLSGTLEVLGQVSGAAGGGANALGGALGNVIGGATGQQLQNLAGKALNQRAEIQGTVTATAHPTIAPNWRLAPNLAAQVNVVDVALPVAGVKLNVSSAVKPFLEGAVREQTGALEARLRNDPFIENAARGEWTRLCRAVPLGAAGAGMPNLFLEIRPTRAIAAQPAIDGQAVTLLVGVEAQTRIVPVETKPNCPFPQQLEIVPQGNPGSVTIAVPIDIPFPEVSRLLDAQIANKTYPEDGSGAFAVTIKRAAIAASGERLLISLLVNARKRGLFSFGADAAVHVWGKPVLDQARQILRFTDIALDIDSRGAFGLLGAAADAAVPYLQKTLADKAVIDLNPLAADARKRIATAVGDLAQQANGVSAKVSVDDLRLTDVAYDDKTLRVIANATGAVNVAISSLSGL